MSTYKYYQIDTFTNTLFTGNPAGVCPLNKWIDKEIMQSIAFENNLSETAFYVKSGDCFEIRWFTPTNEVNLCGHATLASAFAEFVMLKNTKDTLTFKSKSGDLVVTKNEDYFTLDFPVDKYVKIALSQNLLAPFKELPIEAYKAGADILLVFKDESVIKKMNPSLEKIRNIKARGVTVTAKGTTFDFVSRFFGPQSGIDEDPVTGSTHTYLTPYWSKILKKEVLQAAQLSKRGGVLNCKNNGERIEISGKAKLYLEGIIRIDN